mgnify:CR=1 FL=1
MMVYYFLTSSFEYKRDEILNDKQLNCFYHCTYIKGAGIQNLATFLLIVELRYLNVKYYGVSDFARHRTILQTIQK